MFSHLVEQRETIIGDASAYLRTLASRFGLARSGVSVDDHSALNHSAVWAGTDFIASTLAQLPIQLRQAVGGDDYQQNSRRIDSPLSRLISGRPNPRQTGFTWRQMTQANAVFHGNGYGWIERDSRYMPVAIWPISARHATPVISETGLVYNALLDGKPFTVSADDMLHIPGFSMSGLRGLSLVEYMREAIGLGLAAQQFGSAFFGDGANPRFIVTHPGEVGPEGLQKLSTQLNAMYSGLQNAMRAAVIDEGMKVEKLSISPNEAQFLDTRKDNRVEIAGAMRIPPQMIGVYDRATWSNSEQMDIFVVKYTLSSWVARWEQELNAKLLTERQRMSGMFWKINMNGLLRGDMKARTEYYRVMMQGVLAPNEIRALEDFNTIPGLDTPFVPLNMGQPADDPQAFDTPPADDPALDSNQ